MVKPAGQNKIIVLTADGNMSGERTCLTSFMSLFEFVVQNSSNVFLSHIHTGVVNKPQRQHFGIQSQ